MGIPGLLLMESAGEEVARRLMRDFSEQQTRGIVIFCGKGNNGGDGLVIARRLARRGVSSRVVLLARRGDLTGDPALNLAAASASGVEILEAPDEAALASNTQAVSSATLLVDAILGTGVRGGARGVAAAAIEAINGSELPVASVDLPSGLDADSAGVANAAVAATRTYTLCRPKPCLVLDPAARHAGALCIVPIGIPDPAVEQEQAGLEWLDAASVRGLLAPRDPASHKGTFGHLLAVAGSVGKSGAAVLVGRGALRCGAGLVTVAGPASIQAQVASQQAELMTEPLPETASGALGLSAGPRALKLLGQRDALALGPGLGIDGETASAVVSIIAERGAPAVIDADGLNAIALTDDRLSQIEPGKHPLVLTPHPGEAARLLECSTQEIEADRMTAARALAGRTGAVVVLKGHRTLIAAPDGRVSINSSGNPGMAGGGTGDVLTGMIGAFLARGMNGRDAARLAVFAHGHAGDRAAQIRGQEGLTASDLLMEVPASLVALAGPEEFRPW